MKPYFVIQILHHDGEDGETQFVKRCSGFKRYAYVDVTLNDVTIYDNRKHAELDMKRYAEILRRNQIDADLRVMKIRLKASLSGLSTQLAA